MVLCRAGQVGDIAPFPVFPQFAGSSAHDIAVYVDRIDGVGHAHAVVPTQDLTDVAGVAFGTVVDEDFSRAQADAARSEIIFEDGFNQKIVALLWSVSMECFSLGHFVHGLMHGRDTCLWQRAGHVAYAQTDEPFARMGHFERVYFLGDVRE